jgi:hypothetical protein
MAQAQFHEAQVETKVVEIAPAMVTLELTLSEAQSLRVIVGGISSATMTKIATDQASNLRWGDTMRDFDVDVARKLVASLDLAIPHRFRKTAYSTLVTE